MKLHRFITDFERWGESRLLVTNPAVIHQVTKVLRMVSGDEFVVVIGQGEEARVLISDDSSKKVLALDICERFKVAHDPRRMVILCAAVLKKESFEWVVQKATEVGVHSIIPVLTERTVKTSLSYDRLEMIAREAAEQCGRTTVPEILPITKLDALLADGFDGQTYWADTTNEVAGANGKQTSGAARVFVGPEGGWTDAERALASAGKYLPLSLGDTILRAETAAVIATYKLLNS